MASSRGNQPKVLVDTVITDLKLTTSLKPLPVVITPPPTPETDLTGESDEPKPGEMEDQEDFAPPSEMDQDELAEDRTAFEANVQLENDDFFTASVAGDDPLLETGDPLDSWVSDWAESWGEEEGPPPPDLFPPDWDLANAVVEAVAHPAASMALADLPPVQASTPEPTPEVQSIAAAGLETRPPVEEDRLPEATAALPAYIVSPLAPEQGDRIQMLTIILRPSTDKIRDNLRIRQIYGTLITYPGKDRFAFHVFEHGRGYLIEFPNFTTGLCPELLNRLKAFVPAEQLRIEPITFQ